jgi:hypothetical protein
MADVLYTGKEKSTSRSVCRKVYATKTDSLLAGELAFAPASCVSGAACCIQNPRSCSRTHRCAQIGELVLTDRSSPRTDDELMPTADAGGRVWGCVARRTHLVGALVGRVEYLAAHRMALCMD